MNQKGNDEFCTPKHLFDQLDDIFKFELDVACTSHNNLLSDRGCIYYEGGFCYDKKFDGLKLSWGDERCFCNPPFSDKAKWIEKAYNEVINGNCPICVMILPTNCMDSKAWHKYIEGKMFYEILEGRVSFIDPKTQEPKSGNNSGTIIVYFKKKIKR
jgi:site-specific DNA-methyltransferase (adenine-specific)